MKGGLVYDWFIYYIHWFVYYFKLFITEVYMNVLIACEESQRVCTEFRKRGHEAFSCDLLPCSGGHPEWHINYDVIKLLHPGYIRFITSDNKLHIIDNWDMVISFPPCTHLCNAGQRWFKSGHKDINLQYKAIEFFKVFTNLYWIDKVIIENPVGIMSSKYRKPDQIINPFLFGDTDCKRTCLWLKGVNPLIPTNIIPVEKRTNNNWKAIFNGKQYSWNNPETSVLRSKTYFGIAKAMAEQWG